MLRFFFLYNIFAFIYLFIRIIFIQDNNMEIPLIQIEIRDKIYWYTNNTEENETRHLRRIID